jgi:hypothetical protein
VQIIAAAFVNNKGHSKVIHISDFPNSDNPERELLVAINEELLKYDFSIGWYSTGVGLRHGRKYNLHGWISTQRIAHLNTNALQQLHSYFVSTMPRPYDRQLIADTFAVDDAFMDRTLTFQNGGKYFHH